MKQYYFLFLICIFCKISLGQIKQIDVSDQVTTILCPDSTVTIADEKFNLLNGKVNNLDSVIYVSSGKEYAFFLKADSTLWAIGNNVNGEQAIGSCDNDYHHLHKIQGLKKVVKIVSNSYHNVAAIDAEGYAWIWGYYKNNLNECEALGTTLCKPHKLDIDSVVDIAICYMTILIQTKDGKIWRGGGYDGLLEDVFDLKEVPGMKGIKKFGCGIYNGFGIDTVGNLFTCSYSNNEINFLDNNVSNVKSSNTLCIYLKNGSVWMRNIIDIENINIVGPTNVKEIICNEVGGVAISDSDEIWTWVYNGNGLYSQFQKRNWNCINCQKFTLDSLIIDTIINPNTNVQLYANKSSGNRYSWLPSIGVSDTTIQNPVINIESTNNYKVSLYNSDGCVYENDIIKLNVRLCDTIIKKYPLFALDTIVIPETSDTLKAMGVHLMFGPKPMDYHVTLVKIQSLYLLKILLIL